MEEFNMDEARRFIAEKFGAQGDFNILPKDVFEKMLDKVMALDEAFMAESGVNDGAVYDDDQAFEYMMKGLQAMFASAFEELDDMKEAKASLKTWKTNRKDCNMEILDAFDILVEKPFMLCEYSHA